MSVTIKKSDGTTVSYEPPVTIEVTAASAPTPTPPSERFPFRAIYVRDTEFQQCYPNAFRTMKLNAMECYIYSGSTNLKTRFSQLQAPDLGWSVLSGFTPSTTGGVFKLTDADCTAAVKSIVAHPLNSHRYYIADEPNLTGFTKAQQDLNRNKLKARRDLIHAADPQAIVSLADYRQAQLDPVQSGRAGGMWKGIVDEVWLSGYPFPNAVQAPTVIPNQAKWCDAAGIPYIGCLSCHDYQTNKPAYPTQAQLKTAKDQWAATKAVGLALYIWFDAEGTRHLRDDPTMQSFIGTLWG